MRLVTLLVLAACATDPPDTGTPPVPPWLIDDDGDAYSADVDCDDADPDVHPGANEVCDGRDQDCDAIVDEYAIDAPRWYSDDDGDGVGDDHGFTASCEPVPDTLPTGGDCDDLDPAVHPAAEERCNGVDDDCDDAVDEGDLPDEPTWHRDADGDGYGDPGDALIVCAAPEGYVADATDCDDTDATVSPAGVETCDDVDDDCDGLVDEDAVDAYLFYADLDDDTYGDAGTTRTACRGADGWSARLGDCDDTDPTVSPRGEETCDGRDEDCDGEIDEDARGARAWFPDEDGDDYGAEGRGVEACEAPAGWVSNEYDCDDTDAAVSPRADEWCDAFDWDCDGSATAGAVDAPTWYRDADGDGFGTPERTRASCEAPTSYVADATDCDDADAEVSPAAEEVCGDEVDDDCDGADAICEETRVVAVRTRGGTGTLPERRLPGDHGADLRLHGANAWTGCDAAPPGILADRPGIDLPALGVASPCGETADAAPPFGPGFAP